MQRSFAWRAETRVEQVCGHTWERRGEAGGRSSADPEGFTVLRDCGGCAGQRLTRDKGIIKAALGRLRGAWINERERERPREKA